MFHGRFHLRGLFHGSTLGTEAPAAIRTDQQPVQPGLSAEPMEAPWAGGWSVDVTSISVGQLGST